jgi:hypothetical protein
LEEELNTGLDIDLLFDDPKVTPVFSMVEFGKTYTGKISIENSSTKAYLVLRITPLDPDMQIEQLEGHHRQVWPGETQIATFTLQTDAKRKIPVEFGVNVHGGYII